MSSRKFSFLLLAPIVLSQAALAQTPVNLEACADWKAQIDNVNKLHRSVLDLFVQKNLKNEELIRAFHTQLQRNPRLRGTIENFSRIQIEDTGKPVEQRRDKDYAQVRVPINQATVGMKALIEDVLSHAKVSCNPVEDPENREFATHPDLHTRFLLECVGNNGADVLHIRYKLVDKDPFKRHPQAEFEPGQDRNRWAPVITVDHFTRKNIPSEGIKLQGDSQPFIVLKTQIAYSISPNKRTQDPTQVYRKSSQPEFALKEGRITDFDLYNWSPVNDLQLRESILKRLAIPQSCIAPAPAPQRPQVISPSVPPASVAPQKELPVDPSPRLRPRLKGEPVELSQAAQSTRLVKQLPEESGQSPSVVRSKANHWD